VGALIFFPRHGIYLLPHMLSKACREPLQRTWEGKGARGWLDRSAWDSRCPGH
jgi:hypothetical protein